MNFEQFNQSILSGKNAEALKRLAEGKFGQNVAGILDEAELVQAAKSGDTEKLSALLRGVLSTPQGKALADEVKRTVKE